MERGNITSHCVENSLWNCYAPLVRQTKKKEQMNDAVSMDNRSRRFEGTQVS